MSDPSPNGHSRLVPFCGAGLLLLLALSLLPADGSVASGARSKVKPAPLASPEYSAYLPAMFQAVPTPTPYRQHLPVVVSAPPSAGCPLSSTQQWGQMAPRQSFISGAAASPDLNLRLRGWYWVPEPLGLAVYAYPPDEPPDTQHPLFLSSVVPGSDVSAFAGAYQVYDWDWLGCNCPVPRDPVPYPVTMLSLRTTPGQPLRIARRDLPVDPQGFSAMVLYADANQLALKYTWEDRVDTGYLVHLENLCVDPNLVAVYERLDGEGRHFLPGVYNESLVGSAWGDEVDVVVRDSGSFMDPRSWKDWWQDMPWPGPGPAPLIPGLIPVRALPTGVPALSGMAPP